ncbi:MAG: OsmC family protein [Propionibacteriaceae bacterium]|nr:OsmC family protein [Propionibacteriaceae bacterium]
MTVNPNSVVHLVRTGQGRYLAMNRNGTEIELGEGDSVFSPVELLLAALAGCAALDVEAATTRAVEPEVFKVGVLANKGSAGGNHLEDVQVNFSMRFPDTEEGREAKAMVEQVLQLSREQLGTVCRTIENPTPVDMTVKFCQPFRESMREAS